MRIIRRISRFIAERKIEKSLTSKSDSREFLSYSQIKTCLLLYGIDRDDDFRQPTALVKAIEADGIDVTLCCYVRKKKTDIRPTSKRIVFARKQLSLLGKPETAILQQVRDTSFDAVFDFTRHSHTPMLYILMEAQAQLYCSTDTRKKFLFNLILNTDNLENKTEINDRFVLDQLRLYLRKINR